MYEGKQSVPASDETGTDSCAREELNLHALAGTGT